MMDATALKLLEQYIHRWQAQGIHIQLMGVAPIIQKQMQRFGLHLIVDINP